METGLLAITRPFGLTSKDRNGCQMKYAPLGLEKVAVQNLIQRLESSLKACRVADRIITMAVDFLKRDPILTAAMQVCQPLGVGAVSSGNMTQVERKTIGGVMKSMQMFFMEVAVFRVLAGLHSAPPHLVVKLDDSDA